MIILHKLYNIEDVQFQIIQFDLLLSGPSLDTKGKATFCAL